MERVVFRAKYSYKRLHFMTFSTIMTSLERKKKKSMTFRVLDESVRLRARLVLQSRPR